MHIAHVTSFYSVSALSPSSFVQARGVAYRAAGHEFSVIVPGTVASVAWTEYGTVITVPARGAALRRGFVPIPLAIRRALERLVPDRLEVADRLSFRLLGSWAHENHVPALLFADDVPSSWATDTAVQNYDRIVCGEQNIAPVPENLPREKLVSMRQGVDLEIFSPLRHNSALRDSSGANLILVCAAPLTAAGAVSLAIDVVRQLTAQSIDVHLVILGDGPLRNRLERSSEGLPVQFLSARNQKLHERAEVFATADFVLVTAGGVVGHSVALEALASGTPVIDSGNNRHPLDFLTGGGTVTAADPAHIVRAVAALSQEPVESRRLAARRSALEFDAMPLTRAMVTLHESLH
ncbi:glycosyltransferase [Salinibacterium sp. M195]|uniref:glycosyltransferase n=1 Tax=Salinibacterium sp. M195 TaxID=2583374 RepID=UPI001C627ED9|nr:glycosyltransferase [Salinibacterium sp. M195]QYH36160.1 glycosyltransferase family 1 protein [Salinibacterium sp. M195]